MKRKLVVLGIILCSILCMFGCNKDPYQKMTLEKSIDDSVVQLNIKETTTGGKTEYIYDTYSFDVQVKNVGNDIDPKVSLSGGQEYVDYTLSYLGEGITRITVTPRSYEKTGKFTLTIKTVEGNKSLTVDFAVDLKLNNFFIKEDNLEVIAKGQEIDFGNIERYIDFSPINTTQKDIEFSVVVPNADGQIDGHLGVNYVFDNDYDPSVTYAKVEGNVLKTYEGDDVYYPKIKKSVTVGGADSGSEEYVQCITLKASYVGKDADLDGSLVDRYIDVIVLEDCDDKVNLRMNCQKNESQSHVGDDNSFVLDKNANGEYDVVLLNPNYRYGISYDTYFIERDLIFDFGTSGSNGSGNYNPNDYIVSTTPIYESDDQPVVISFSSNNNSFKVQSQKAGRYSHKFIIDHVDYPGIIAKEVTVNFIVLDIPTDIKVNGTVTKDAYKVYKNYGNSWGTRFTIGLTNANSFNYFVFTKSNELLNNLKMYKADGTEQVFAVCQNENGFETISSSKDGIGYSNFRSNETFYLRHNFDTLPDLSMADDKDKQIYIGVMYDVTTSSYSDEVKQSYFTKAFLQFPITLDFEIGLQDINFSQSKYVVDVTNEKLSNGEHDMNGIKLFDLPAGQSLDSVINSEDIVYDKSLIDVYELLDTEENVVYLYLKANTQLKEGKTYLSIRTKNNLYRSVEITTFIPTCYAENENLNEGQEKMPLGLSFDEDAVLYYFTKSIDGTTNIDPQAKYTLYKNGEIWQENAYLSLDTLIMLKDSSINMRFYDYLLAYDTYGQKVVTPIDITNKVSVSFDPANYAEFKNGILYAYKVTRDINNPVVMTIRYTGGYMKTNADGIDEYTETTFELKIKLYIYLALQGVQVTTPKYVDIYVDESLGIFNKDMARHTIKSDFIPNEVNLGAQWNKNWINEFLPVDLTYDIQNTLESQIYLPNGQPIILYSNDSRISRELRYKDIFSTVDETEKTYTCPIYCKISDSLDNWIRKESGYTADEYNWFIQNKIFGNDISMVVNVYITQFSKLQNINSVRFNAKYANKITGFNLDIADDGVYFENRKGESGKQEQNIAYSVDASNAVNKEIMLINAENAVYSAKVNAGAMGINGTINIIARGAGIEYLTAVPKDNIKTYDSATGEYTYYNPKLVQTFRIKVADGSREYPFEIQSASDYIAMQEDIKSNDYYYYVLTRDINLSEVTNGQATFVDTQNVSNLKTFSLNGQYSYRRNGVEYTKNSTLFNLYINRTINSTEDVNVGLFQALNNKVKLQNITLKNFLINLRLENVANLNVGLLAGSSTGAEIKNCEVSGTIKITNNIANNTAYSISAGGIIGSMDKGTLSGLPVGYINGISNNSYNANVCIDYSMKNDNASYNGTYCIGGVIGTAVGTEIQNLNILPTIKGMGYAGSVGGVVGSFTASKLENIVVYPMITILDNNDKSEGKTINIGLIAGTAKKSGIDTNTITNSKVFYIKENNDAWLQNVNTNIITKASVNFGGIVGSAESNNTTISYSYVRSFYSQIEENKYYANIYISANSESKLGGIVGTANSTVTIQNSYFDADVLLNGSIDTETNVITLNNAFGLIAGSMTDIASNTIVNVYSISNISVRYLNGSNYVITSISGIEEKVSLIGSVALSPNANADIFGTGFNLSNTSTKKSASVNINIDKVYGIFNSNVYFIGSNNSIYEIYEEDKELVGDNGIVTGASNIFELFNNSLGYGIIEIQGSTSTNNQTYWIWDKDVNKVGSLAFPILLDVNKTKALYDLVPTGIWIDRVNKDYGCIYDVSYEYEENNQKIIYNQIIMNVFKSSTSDVSDYNKYYEVAVDSQTSAISLRFDGQTTFTRFLEINSDILISEDSEGRVIEVIGNKIYTRNSGIVTLTICSALDKTVKLDIKIQVIEGVSEILLDLVDNVSNTEIAGNDIPTVYIDELSTFAFKNINELDGKSYNSSNLYGYQLILLESANSDEEIGVISINNKEYSYNDNGNNIYIINTSNLSVKGVKTGFVRFKVSPIIYLDEFEHDENNNYKVLDNIENEFVILCNARAKNIKLSSHDIKIAPKNITNFTLSLETSNLKIGKVEGQENKYNISILDGIDIRVGSRLFQIQFANIIGYEATLTNNKYYVDSFNYEIDYELIRIKISGFNVKQNEWDISTGKYTYIIEFNLSVNFNANYYRAYADNFNLNTLSYVYTFKPTSNETVSDKLDVSISPNILSTIFTNYYSRGELLVNSDNLTFPSENESKFIVPGTAGMLKITLDEEFSDSSYITVTLNKSYEDYVSISQMAGQVDTYVNPDTSDLTDYIDSYRDIAYRQTVETDTTYGIRLSKMTLNYDDLSYFSKTYFVKVNLIRDYGDLQNVNITITSYKINQDGVSVHLTKTITLSVTQLPRIDVKVDDSYSAVIGKGVEKPLEITYSGISSNIGIYGFNSDELVYIADENGKKVTELDLDYLNEGKQYFLRADVASELKELNNISFMVSEMVMGVRETTQANLKIKVVDFEIDDIKIDGSYDGVVTIKHGQNFILNTNITYKPITVGDEEERKKYEEKLVASDIGKVHLAEYASAGASVEPNSIYENNSLEDRLRQETYVGNDRVYKPIYTDSQINYLSLNESEVSRNNITIHYYYLKGTGVTGNNAVNLNLVVPYSYVDGELLISKDIFGHSTIEIDFSVVVEDSSTYDHPNPIETPEDLISACNSEGGDFILLNNIELNSWVPIDAKFDSLDGNGYVIKVNSFNLTNATSGDGANVGVFATTAENTLLKNIIVDVSSMLITETEMLSQVDALSNYTKDNYPYLANIDLAFVNDVVFGILVGTNNGSITNARIINMNHTYANSATTKMYYHVVTTQGYLDNTLINTKIGGVAGVNSETGAITNSYVGLNKATMDTNDASYIELVKEASAIAYNNEQDKLEVVEIYPFTIAGGNIMGGLVAENNGIISNSYTKGLGLYNTYPAVTDSMTGGLVAENNGTITSCFVESRKISQQNYRAIEDNFVIESTGNVGGLVYSNNLNISNSYSNAYLETQSAFTGGFIFVNNANGIANNCYTTTVNRNSLAHGQFTGIAINGRDVLNYGIYNNCYYLVLKDENINEREKAKAIETESSPISDKNSWRGFSFATATNAEGLWVLSETSAPIIASSLVDINSFRRLSETREVTEGDVTISIYDYEYVGYGLGSLHNPLIIDNAENFDKYIIDNAIDINGKMTFGATSYSSGNLLSEMNAVRHVRLVNNMDFENITTATMYKNTYLYQTVFAGVLDGNGMTLKNLNINTDTAQLENFGMFAQVGVTSDISTIQTVVKNLNLTLRTYKSSDTSKSGVLAGTIVNSNIINVSISGAGDSASATIGGRNMAGALAGLIYADQNGTVSLFDITVQNVIIEASYGSLNGEITADSKDKSNGFYNKFSIKNIENEIVEKSFSSLYDKLTKTSKLEEKTSQVSYAGGIAGVIIANNYSTIVDDSVDASETSKATKYETYRTAPDNNSIDNLIVKNAITIRTADNSGGLFGYIGEKTLIKNSKFELGDNQLIKAFNFAGGIVAENHGVIEQCAVAYANSLQDTIDENIIELSDTSNPNVQIFDTTSTNNDYTVAIGGIAGYSSNGVILDSYSKVNVIKSNAYIAGGLIGYSENYNYIAYSYTSGAVYSKLVTGGLIGLQVNSGEKQGTGENKQLITNDNDYLVMYQTYALTNWNLVVDSLDIRQSTTNKLYENQKVLYKKSDGTYRNFYVKMAEIGNLSVITTDNALTETYQKTITDNNKYVGSAIGYAIINSSDNSNSLEYTYSQESKEIITKPENYKFNELTNKSSKIVTNTLGIYSTRGSLASGNKVDDYFSQTFSYSVDTSNNISLYSYKIAYRINDNLLNANSEIAIGDDASADQNKYYDIFSYAKIFDQEYIEQMLGGYTSVIDSSNKMTANVFRYEYNINTAGGRFEKSVVSDGDTFINTNNDYIWGMGKYLPKYSYGLFKSIQKIKNEAELNTAFTTLSTGRIYIVEPETTDYKIEVNFSSTEATMAYAQTIRDTFVGTVKEDGTKPTIVFNIKGADASNLTLINSIFNLLSGVTFNNLNLEFNFENVNYSINKYNKNWGLIANVLQNSTIVNCNITLNAEDVIIQKGNAETFNCETVGILFGSVINSVIRNTTFTINVGEIDINEGTVANFGVFAGYVENGSLIDNKYNFAKDININVSNANSNANVAGLVGVFNYATIKNSSEVSFTHNVTINVNAKLKQLNGAYLFGYSNNSNIQDITTNSNLIVNLNSEVENMSVAYISAMTMVSRLSKISVVGTGASNGKLTVTGNTIIANASIGTIIGEDLRESELGGDGIVTSNASINANVNVDNLSVGGLIGSAGNANSLCSIASFLGGIDIVNLATGSSITTGGNTTINYANTNIGGILGESTGFVGLGNVLSDAQIKTKISENNESILSLGGIIGKTNSSCEITNFSVLSDFDVSDCTFKSTSYVSGIIGNNGGLFTGINGFVLCELPNDKSNLITSASVSRNGIANNTSNIFISQELIGTNYNCDSMFETFALADLYNAISEYSNLGIKLKDLGNLTAEVAINKMHVLIPNGTSVSTRNRDAHGLYYPNVINGDTISSISNSKDTPRYNYILSDSNGSIGTLDKGRVISGRTTENGKVIINASGTSGATTPSYVVTTNNGIISNIYFNTSDADGNALNAVLVNGNNGLITNVYVYGKTENTVSIAITNNDRIVSSGSNIVCLNAPQMDLKDFRTETYGLVYTNGGSGFISDCYSSNFASNKNTKFKNKIYGLASVNLGTIQYSTYFIPDIMEYENILAGSIKTNSDATIQGKIHSVYSSSNPGFIKNRSSIWTYDNENGHAQIKGIKDIKGNILIKVKAKGIINNSEKETYDIGLIKDWISDMVEYRISGTVQIDYDIYFYSQETLSYNVIRFDNGSEFTAYINSLGNDDIVNIPNNTIILLESQGVMTIGDCKAFNIPSSSMVLGITNVTTNNGVTTYSNVILKAQNVYKHEFINTNSGVFAGFSFVDFKFKNSNNGYNYFAPIINNYGIIYNINIESSGTTITTCIDGGYGNYVAGIVVAHYSGAVINDCNLNYVELKCQTYGNYICNISIGVVANCGVSNLTFVGQIADGGNNGQNRY